jgi:hypothetical protein
VQQAPTSRALLRLLLRVLRHRHSLQWEKKVESCEGSEEETKE